MLAGEARGPEKGGMRIGALFWMEYAIDTSGNRQAEEGRQRRHGCRKSRAPGARDAATPQKHLYNSISRRHLQPAISLGRTSAAIIGAAGN